MREDDEYLVDEEEARELEELINRAFEAPTMSSVRRNVLADAYLRFGMVFHWALIEAAGSVPEEMMEPVETLVDEAAQCLFDWVGGEQLTDRIDEDERRAATALDLLATYGPQITRIAMRAVLRLPKDHPQHDLTTIRQSLEQHLERVRSKDDWLGIVLTLQDILLNHELADAQTPVFAKELMDVATRHELPLDDEVRKNALRTVAGWWILEAKAHRADNAFYAAALDEVSRCLDLMLQFNLTPQDNLMIALQLDELGKSQEAADLLKANTSADTSPEFRATMAWTEAKVRVGLRQPARVIELLAPLIDEEEQRYLLALSDEDTRHAAERLSTDGTELALSYALEGRWSQCLATIERVKSPRLRHSSVLRLSVAGREFLKREAAYVAARRGAPSRSAEDSTRENDPLGQRVTRTGKLLEAMRVERPDLETTNLVPPSVDLVGSKLDDDEAVVSLASGRLGLATLVILPGDTGEPTGCWVDEELPTHKVLELFQIPDQFYRMEPDIGLSGWLLELAAYSPVQPEKALDAMLRNVDKCFATRLASFLTEHGVRRVTMIPNRMLHLVPYWALPSMAPFDVRVAPSLAHWYQAREARPRELLPKVIAVGDPTGDLGKARAEAVAVAHTLELRRLQSLVILGKAASEEAVREALRGSGIFHFAGHGLLRPMQPLACALVLQPDQQWGWPSSEPLAAMARGISEWSINKDKLRFADVPKGRLVEDRDEETGEVSERWLEHGEQGTLWGYYRDGYLIQLGELWTVADILADDAVKDCAIAFLAACDSGIGALRLEVDEAMGLPGAMLVAGVSTVICTLWPIADDTALVFATLFYRRLAQAGSGNIDVVGILDSARRELRELTRTEAMETLNTVREGTPDKVARAELQHAISQLASASDAPFAHPYHWAAFAALGAENVHVDWPHH